MGSSFKSPELLGSVLKRLLKRYGLSDGIQQQEALLHWSDAAGEKIAEVSRPVRVEHGRIFVEVDNTVWRQEILLHKKQIIERLNKRFETEIIRELILV